MHDLTAHTALVAKYRKEVMTKPVHDVIEKSLQDTCVRLGIELIEFNTDTDHAHVLISYPLKYSISEIVRALKTNSSRKVRIECADEIRDKLWVAISGRRHILFHRQEKLPLILLKNMSKTKNGHLEHEETQTLFGTGDSIPLPPLRKGSPGVD